MFGIDRKGNKVCEGLPLPGRGHSHVHPVAGAEDPVPGDPGDDDVPLLTLPRDHNLCLFVDLTLNEL